MGRNTLIKMKNGVWILILISSRFLFYARRAENGGTGSYVFNSELTVYRIHLFNLCERLFVSDGAAVIIDCVKKTFFRLMLRKAFLNL